MTSKLSKTRENIAAACKQLKLPEMAAAFKIQCDNPAYGEMPFEQRLAMLLKAETQSRWQKRQQRNLKNAHLPQAHMARLENMDWDAKRPLNRNLIEQLCECTWLTAELKPWVAIHGATGVGKSFLAKMLTYEACMHSFTASYYRLPELISEIDSARAGGRLINFRKTLLSKQLLVIDEFGIVGMSDENAAEFLTIIEQRLLERSMIIVGQIPLSSWYGYFTDPIKADAIMDRILNQSYCIEIKGPSMREKYGAMALAKETEDATAA